MAISNTKQSTLGYVYCSTCDVATEEDIRACKEAIKAAKAKSEAVVECGLTLTLDGLAEDGVILADGVVDDTLMRQAILGELYYVSFQFKEPIWVASVVYGYDVVDVKITMCEGLQS